MINALTIDVEDYWSILQQDWLGRMDAKPTEAVLKNTRWFLDTFASRNVKATFFILGEVAQAFPQLIKEIADQGHEIGVHGFYHRQIFKLKPDQFKNDIGAAKKLLEDISGKQVFGHRAPAFSINKDTQWALEVLEELGYKYDSSITPMAGKRYGWPGFKKEIHEMKLPNGKSIIEVPMSTITILGKELGIGGGYTRHFPYFYTKWAINHTQKTRPAVIYMHPYEIDLDQSRYYDFDIPADVQKKLAKVHRFQIRNRKFTKYKLEKLLSCFEFTSIINLLN